MVPAAAEATRRPGGSRPRRASDGRAAASGARSDVETAASAETAVCARIQTLGGFAVVPTGAEAPVRWTSKKARDALKILTCQRGRAIHREELIELLWPEVDVTTGRSRLSVVLSLVRAALDPDKRWPGDHALRATRDSVALRLDHLDVDIERLLDLVQSGLLDQSAPAGQDDLRVAVDEVWAGPFLVEDQYEDWSSALRSRVDSAVTAALRALAQAADEPQRSRRGDHPDQSARRVRPL